MFRRVILGMVACTLVGLLPTPVHADLLLPGDPFPGVRGRFGFSPDITDPNEQAFELCDGGLPAGFFCAQYNLVNIVLDGDDFDLFDGEEFLTSLFGVQFALWDTGGAAIPACSNVTEGGGCMDEFPNISPSGNPANIFTDIVYLVDGFSVQLKEPPGEEGGAPLLANPFGVPPFASAEIFVENFGFTGGFIAVSAFFANGDFFRNFGGPTPGLPLPVPEPGTLLLLGAGVAAGIAKRMRSSKRRNEDR